MLEEKFEDKNEALPETTSFLYLSFFFFTIRAGLFKDSQTIQLCTHLSFNKQKIIINLNIIHVNPFKTFLLIPSKLSYYNFVT